MFKKLTMAALFAAFISGPAISGVITSDEVIVTEVKLNEGFTKIIVSGNAEVVLTRDESMTKQLIQRILLLKIKTEYCR
jgi:hypothetical protein